MLTPVTFLVLLAAINKFNGKTFSKLRLVFIF